MISIFIPSLDPVGSSDARQELLTRSLLVTARNPWGIGIGNFPIVATQNHQTHNAFTQVSSELGILGSRRIHDLYDLAIPTAASHRADGSSTPTISTGFTSSRSGLQASIVGYWVSSFFASVAYNWFIYYLLAYAVAFRRIYTSRTMSTRGAGSGAPRSPHLQQHEVDRRTAHFLDLRRRSSATYMLAIRCSSGL